MRASSFALILGSLALLLPACRDKSSEVAPEKVNVAPSAAPSSAPASSASAEPKQAAVANLTTPAERGKYFANAIVDCRACHTLRKPSDQSVAEGPEWGGGEVFDGTIWKLPGTFVTPNLTPDKDTGLGSWTDAEIGRAIRQGINRKGERLFPLMPSHFFQSMADQDLGDLIAYLRTVPAAKKPTEQKTVMTIERSVVPSLPVLDGGVPLPPASDPVARGKYIVTLANCHTCHSPTQKGQPLKERTLAGGVSFTTPFGAFVSPNITSDSDTGVGTWSNEDFKTLFRTGKRKSGAQIVANFMPWYIYKNMTDADLDAIIAYLRTLPAVKNDVTSVKNQFQLGG